MDARGLRADRHLVDLGRDRVPLGVDLLHLVEDLLLDLVQVVLYLRDLRLGALAAARELVPWRETALLAARAI